MPINIQAEQIITFREAAKLCPRRRRGRKPHLSTFYRWSQQGLETIQVGGQLCTSVEARQRFFEQLTRIRSPGQQTTKPVAQSKNEAARQKQIDSDLTAFGL